ncbi:MULTISPECIES: HPF/RaiA family ribosome-associated protein [Crateriforma]|uniref:Sigma 54 modulation protein / S30EA ribosomal protein n=1 Tax=Crateriforma conspicua TaxID=2527996 RepID=A0A5C6FYL6_9PLAN|nr:MULTISPECIES: HPF/RaiA family ribosome-associated protein [Crateriforma]QDV63235.1 Sigma 54 modulation protein / S30EA ribosomal protein [Crateriforma conspicua]TWT67996.1 Sigma 54 modulation protein / S30EA ribosomal protein [Crateriforma conspicua]TWU67466.1 Sigma 54 modulation protein / S30EA ribosomal protein [Crateriforma conspicua]
MMQVLVHTDNHIQGDDRLTELVQESVTDTLERYQDRITRVEVFLADENSREKFGDEDKRCVMEVRLRGRKPVSVRHHDATVKAAFHGAAEKMLHLLEKTLGRLDHRHDPVVAPE